MASFHAKNNGACGAWKHSALTRSAQRTKKTVCDNTLCLCLDLRRQTIFTESKGLYCIYIYIYFKAKGNALAQGELGQQLNKYAVAVTL